MARVQYASRVDEAVGRSERQLAASVGLYLVLSPPPRARNVACRLVLADRASIGRAMARLSAEPVEAALQVACAYHRRDACGVGVRNRRARRNCRFARSPRPSRGVLRRSRPARVEDPPSIRRPLGPPRSARDEAYVAGVAFRSRHAIDQLDPDHPEAHFALATKTAQWSPASARVASLTKRKSECGRLFGALLIARSSPSERSAPRCRRTGRRIVACTSAPGSCDDDLVTGGASF